MYITMYCLYMARLSSIDICLFCHYFEQYISNVFIIPILIHILIYYCYHYYCHYYCYQNTHYYFFVCVFTHKPVFISAAVHNRYINILIYKELSFAPFYEVIISFRFVLYRYGKLKFLGHACPDATDGALHGASFQAHFIDATAV